MTRLILLFATACLGLHAAGWKVHVDKKPSQITGVRNTFASIKARRGGAQLVVGCSDAKPVLRIAENFRLSNKLNDAFTKSQIERAIDKSERFGFAFSVRDGNYFSQLKLRLGGKQEYLDTEVRAFYDRGTYVLVLDERLAELLPGMRTDALLYAQLPYKDGEKVREFQLTGLDSALVKMGQNGCTI